MNKILLTLLIVLAGNVFVKAQEAHQWMESYLRYSPGAAAYDGNTLLKFLQAGNYDGALSGADLCLRQDSSNAVCYFVRAWAKGAKSNYRDCVSDTRQVVKLASAAASDPQLYYIRSICQAGLENFGEAMSDANRAIELAPGIAGGYSQRAALYERQKKYDLMIADLGKVISIAPTAANYNIRAEAYLLQKKYDPAIADLTKSISLKRSYDVIITRGNVYGEMGNMPKAAADALWLASDFEDKDGHTLRLIEGIISVDPKVADAWLARGRLARKAGKDTAAIADYTKAIEADPNGFLAYFERALCYNKIKEFEKAVADNTRVIQLSPKSNLAIYNRGNSYFELGKLDKALEDYSAFITIVPRDEDGYYSRGRVYHKQGKNDLALADLTKAIDVGRESAKLYNLRGDILLKLGKREDAIADYRESVKIDEDNAYAKKALTDLNATFKALLSSLNDTYWRNETDPMCFCKFVFHEDGKLYYYNDSSNKSYYFDGTYVQNGSRFTVTFDSYKEGVSGSKKSDKTVVEGEYYVSPEGKTRLKVVNVAASGNSPRVIKNGLVFNLESED